MFRPLAILALLVPALALADVDQKFAKLRDASEALSSLGSFLDKYVGDCGSVMEGGGECAKNAESFRRGANGKKYYMILTEDSTAVLSLGAFNPQGGEVTLNLTPFFPGSNSAITRFSPAFPPSKSRASRCTRRLVFKKPRISANSAGSKASGSMWSSCSSSCEETRRNSCRCGERVGLGSGSLRSCPPPLSTSAPPS